MERPQKPRRRDGRERSRRDAIQQIVDATVRKRFPGVTIDRVVVEPGVDHDDDPVLRVFVVFESTGPDTLDPSRTVGLIRHLREDLDDIDVDDFSIVRYVSTEEAGELLGSA